MAVLTKSISLLLVAAAASAAPERTLYVAPDASFERARDQIRAARKAGDTERWTVIVRPGRYERTEPLVFTAEDHDTEYRGEKGKTALTGDFLIGGWRAEGQDVWSAAVPGVREGTVWFEQLFVNGRRAIRARWPKFQADWAYGTDRKDLLPVGAVFQSAVTNADGSLDVRQALTARGSDLNLLQGIPSAELHCAALVVHHYWDTTRRIILSYHPATRTVEMSGRLIRGCNPWRESSRYYVENVRTAFTDPGEWFLDKSAGRVFYRPLLGETLAGCSFEAPRNGSANLLVMNGSARLCFNGLTFRVTDNPRTPANLLEGGLPAKLDGAALPVGPTQEHPAQAACQVETAIRASAIMACVFRDCEIRETGGYGIWFREGCVSNTIECCRFCELGAGGIRIGGDAPQKSVPARFNTVRDCTLRCGGRVYAAGVGIWVGEATDTLITHNHIADFFYTGISEGWNWGYGGGAFRNEISWNLIEDIGQNALSDLAGIYTLGTQTGTRVEYNLIRRTAGHPYGGHGIYLDEGSAGILVANNLVHDTTANPYNENYGSFGSHGVTNAAIFSIGERNCISNNIFAFGRQDTQVGFGLGHPEDHLLVSFTKNIFYWAHPGATAVGGLPPWFKSTWQDNLWWSEATPAPVFCGKPFTEWQKAGRDQHGAVADPLFANPSKRDFHFRSDAACRLVGFTPFDLSTVGPR